MLCTACPGGEILHGLESNRSSQGSFLLSSSQKDLFSSAELVKRLKHLKLYRV